MERLKADDPFGGYQSLIRDLKSGLSRISEGKKIRPMDIDDGTVASRFFTDLLMAFVIMAIPTALMTWHQVRKRKQKCSSPMPTSTRQMADWSLLKKGIFSFIPP